MEKSLIKQALARGYCSERNSKKVLDPDLIEDMADEVMKLKPPALPDDVEGKMRTIVHQFKLSCRPCNEVEGDFEIITEDETVAQLLSLYPQMASEEIKFNIPKDAEDKRRLLIDIEKVGVILREEKECFIVLKYNPPFNKDFIKKHYDEFLGYYYNSPCSGCSGGHPSFWKSVIESSEWKAWVASRPHYDIPECEELGVISKGHFADFIKFTIAKAKPALTEQGLERIIKIIEDEPELPGKMPNEIWNTIKNNKENMTETLRLTVKKTKANIKQAILKWQRGER